MDKNADSDGLGKTYLEKNKNKLCELKALYSDLKSKLYSFGKYESAKRCDSNIERINKQENNGSLDALIILNIEAEYESLSKTILNEDVCECGSEAFYYDEVRGETVCSKCSLVYSYNQIDEGPEWRVFDDKGIKKVRTGAPPSKTMHDKGLYTIIDSSNKDSSGKALSPNMLSQIYRLRKWQKRCSVHSSSDRNLSFAFSELEKLCGQRNIPKSVKDDAAGLYRKAVDKKMIRGRSIISFMAASLYVACTGYNSKAISLNKTPVPITLNELAERAGTTKKKVYDCIKEISIKLNISLNTKDPVLYISNITESIEISFKTIKQAQNIIMELRDSGIFSGKSPNAIAGAAIYLAGILTHERITQTQIAFASQITEVTVRNRSKDMINMAKKLKLNWSYSF